MDTIYEKLMQLRVEDINHLSMLETTDLCFDESEFWKWRLSASCRLMKKNGFVCDDRRTYYEYADFGVGIKMHYDYLDWIKNYRTEGTRTYHQEEIWLFRNIECDKAWKDMIGNTAYGCFTVPSGKSERSKLSHNVACRQVMV